MLFVQFNCRGRPPDHPPGHWKPHPLLPRLPEPAAAAETGGTWEEEKGRQGRGEEEEEGEEGDVSQDGPWTLHNMTHGCHT